MTSKNALLLENGGLVKTGTFQFSKTKNFKRPKNREDSSDFDENWTE